MLACCKARCKTVLACCKARCTTVLVCCKARCITVLACFEVCCKTVLVCCEVHCTVPCLHGAVELLLTGDQHKPCASFNQQARKNTLSVAEGKRKTPQKIASKGAKICKKKKSPHFGVQKWTRFGACFFKKGIGKPQNGSIFGPQKWSLFFTYFCAF